MQGTVGRKGFADQGYCKEKYAVQKHQKLDHYGRLVLLESEVDTLLSDTQYLFNKEVLPSEMESSVEESDINRCLELSTAAPTFLEPNKTDEMVLYYIDGACSFAVKKPRE